MAGWPSHHLLPRIRNYGIDCLLRTYDACETSLAPILRENVGGKSKVRYFILGCRRLKHHFLGAKGERAKELAREDMIRRS